MEISPKQIYLEYENGNLEKKIAVDHLIALINNSDDANLRIVSIEILEKIGSKDENIFSLLENLLISDSNEKVRNSAASVLKSLFFDKILEPMRFALFHEESTSCLNTIYLTLIEIIQNLVKRQDSLTKSILFNEVNNIRKREFKIGFETLCEKNGINNFINKELADILINYFTIVFLEKTYWRLKYKIEKCKIIELDFIFKGLTSLPLPIKYLTSLKTLILRYNQLTSLPNWVNSLSSLENLNININNLNKLPESLGLLKSLKQLLLWKNELKNLPESIGSLSSLEILNIRLNQLNALPESIGNLKNLKELNLHDNHLTYIPISIKALNSLEKLNLSWNSIDTLPNSIGTLSSLKFLDLERNELSSLPNSIGDLTSLKILNLSDNKLKEIPESIGKLGSLQSLNLSRNELDFLPKSINKLTSLKEVYLAENYIKKVPKDLKDLENNELKIYL